MACVVIKSLGDKVIESPSSKYMVGDIVEIPDVDGNKYTLVVLGRRWVNGKDLEILCDFSLRFRDLNDLEEYFFSDPARDILPELSDSVLEALFTGTLPDDLKYSSGKINGLLEKMDDVAKESGIASSELLQEILSYLKSK